MENPHKSSHNNESRVKLWDVKSMAFSSRVFVAPLFKISSSVFGS